MPLAKIKFLLPLLLLAGLAAMVPEAARGETFSDDFSAGLDPNLFSVTQTTEGLFSLDATQGVVHLVKTGSSPGGVQNIDVVLNMQGVLGGPVTGDFSVQIDFANAMLGPSVDQAELHTHYADGTIFFDVYDNSSGENVHVWNGVNVNNPTAVTATGGTFKIIRSGSMVTGFFNGAMIYSQSISAPLTEIDFVLQLQPGSDDYPQVDFDNFSVSTAVLPGSVQLSAASALVTESVGSTTLSVSRTGGSTGAVSVNYATADDTALAGTDYQATSGTLSWADGDATPKTITVPIINRSLTAGSTLFLVNLSSPAGGVTLASPTQAAVTILDTASTADIVSVTLLSPPAGVTLTQGQPVVLQADVEALSGTLSNVEFFAVDSLGNSTDLGGTASPRGQVTWTPTAAGSYTLQVVATDINGNTQQTTSAVTVVAAGAALPQTTLEAGLDGITVPLNTAVPVVAQAVDSAGNALQNVQFYLDGVPVASAPASAIRRADLKAANASAGTLYVANVLASKIQQVMTAVGTTASGVSSVSTVANIYGKADAGTPPTATISNLASGASVPTSAGQSVSVSATSGSQAIAKVQLVVDNQNVGVATAAPFTFNLPALAAGLHAMGVIVTDVGSLSSVSAPVYITAEQTATQNAAFFTGETALSNGVYYLSFPNGNYFGYYSFLPNPAYLYHFDLGFEYVFDAADGKSGVYLYDFTSSTFFYTSPTFPFPYLYDFTLNSVLYYYPDPNNAGHYNTDGIRYFYDFNTGTIITK